MGKICWRAFSTVEVSMAVGLTSMLIAILFGTVSGAVAGYCGGSIDNVLMRLTDLFISLPQLPLLLLVVYLFRDPMRRLFDPEMGIFLLIVLVIGGLGWMQPARLVRAAFLSLKEKEFVEAAMALGTPPFRLVVRHVLPNALSPVIVAASLGSARPSWPSRPCLSSVWAFHPTCPPGAGCSSMPRII
jgi:peptide/nickel transport system permease protein